MLNAQHPRPRLLEQPDPISGSGKWQDPTPTNSDDPRDYYVLAHLRTSSGKVVHKAVHTDNPEDWIRRLGRNRKLYSYRWWASTSLQSLMYRRWFLELQSAWERRAVKATWFCPSCKGRADATMTDELTA